MVNQMTKKVGELIDKGLSDHDILTRLLDEHGPDLLRQHQTLIAQ